jgi:hypothetical protein
MNSRTVEKIGRILVSYLILVVAMVLFVVLLPVFGTVLHVIWNVLLFFLPRYGG